MVDAAVGFRFALFLTFAAWTRQGNAFQDGASALNSGVVIEAAQREGATRRLAGLRLRTRPATESCDCPKASNSSAECDCSQLTAERHAEVVTYDNVSGVERDGRNEVVQKYNALADAAIAQKDKEIAVRIKEAAKQSSNNVTIENYAHKDEELAEEAGKAAASARLKIAKQQAAEDSERAAKVINDIVQKEETARADAAIDKAAASAVQALNKSSHVIANKTAIEKKMSSAVQASEAKAVATSQRASLDKAQAKATATATSLAKSTADEMEVKAQASAAAAKAAEAQAEEDRRRALEAGDTVKRLMEQAAAARKAAAQESANAAVDLTVVATKAMAAVQKVADEGNEKVRLATQDVVYEAIQGGQPCNSNTALAPCGTVEGMAPCAPVAVVPVATRADAAPSPCGA